MTQVELTEDEVRVLNRYRELVGRGFGDHLISVHKSKLVKNWITIKDDIPIRLRESHNGK